MNNITSNPQLRYKKYQDMRKKDNAKKKKKAK
jgi:hypothetical protein